MHKLSQERISVEATTKEKELQSLFSEYGIDNKKIVLSLSELNK